MAKRRLNIPLNFGQHGGDVDKKHAPHGWLRTAKNVRMRERGRLGTRNGYVPATMTTRNGTLVAYDLAEYRGRLLAFGSDEGDGYATETFEYVNNAADRWRGTDPYGQRVTVNPFTNLREVSGVPQSEGGNGVIDAAAGGGYVCAVYQPNDSFNAYAIIVDQDTDQVIHHEVLSSSTAGGGVFGGTTPSSCKIAFAGGTFYILARLLDESLKIASFTVGTSASFASFATPASGTGVVITDYDIVPVTNATTARVAVAFDRVGAIDLSILVYQSNGSQLGSTITVSGTATVHLSLEADQADNTINLYTVETTNTGRLRTFSFAGALLDGPTAVTTGVSGSICRLPAQPGFAEHVAVAVNNASSNIVIQVIDQDAHTVTSTTTVQQAVLRSRLLSGQTANQDIAVVFSALVAPELPGFDQATNAIFFVTPDVAHMTTRDFVKAMDPDFVNLTEDTTTGKLCWVALRDPGVESLGVPAITLLDFQSTDRRQTAKYGGLLYMAGGTPSVYDGRIAGELGFQEVPGIISATASNSTGTLTGGATYYYAAHWEIVLADGSLMLSPPSVGANEGESVCQQATSVTLGAADDTVTLVVTTPHSVRVALGNALYGADVTLVISRTQWNPITGTPGSVLRRAVATNVPIGMANYGKLRTVIDTTPDATLATQEPIYTQGERGIESGPLEQNAPRACSYITASESRLILGGLARSFEFQMSRAAFLSEAYSFSEFSSFFGQVSAPIVAVQSLDSARVLFTAADIFAVIGDGPDDLGGGAIGDPLEVTSQGGLREDGWRSLLKVPEGLFFQLSDDKLMLLPRGAQSPVWAGEALRTLLTSFPAITGATRVRKDHSAAFACSTATDARVALLDFRIGEWFVDTPPLQTTRGIDAIVDYEDGLAYLSGGTVYVQSASFTDGSSTFIGTELETHPIYPFTVGGHGHCYNAMFTGEFRGACTLTLSVSLDDGVTYTALTAFALTGTAGDTIKRNWTLPDSVMGSVTFRLTTTTSGSATEGVIFNDLTLLVEDAPGLEPLDPAEFG